MVKYHKIANRNTGVYHLDKQTTMLIENKVLIADSPIDIVKKSADITADILTFSESNRLNRGEANCIGYAQVTSAIINDAFRKKGYSYRARPVYGTLSFIGINLNGASQYVVPSASRNFFKDHDWVEVDVGDKLIYVDSSLQDLLGHRFITTMKK